MLQWRALLNSMFGVIYVITEASHAERINYLKTALLLMIDAAQVNAYVFERTGLWRTRGREKSAK